jgi:hypothetical protein
MPVEVGGAGFLGVAFETTLGTYLAPTKFIPIRSESLADPEDKVWRTNIRGLAGRSGAVSGYYHAEGDIVFEVTSDVLPYFMYASRVTPTKTGVSAPFTYSFVPAHVAKSTTLATDKTKRKTLSILVDRGSQYMAYVGMSVSQLTFSLDNGLLVCTASMIGNGEIDQTVVTPTWPTSIPFGPGKVTLEVPSGTPRSDADTFNVTINDNGTASNRLNGQRSAAYINWGEREITASFEHDFDTESDYNVFKNQTQQILKVIATNSGTNDQVTMLVNAAIEEAYTVNLGSIGDVNRGGATFHGLETATGGYTITILTTEDCGGT